MESVLQAFALFQMSDITFFWAQKNRPSRPVFSVLHLPSKNNVRQNFSGAGRGNRTLVGSLGSYCSTIKLYPLRAADFVPDVLADLKFFFENSVFYVPTVDRGQAAPLGNPARPQPHRSYGKRMLWL